MSVKNQSLENILQLLLQYKYFVLFPLAIVEGPIIAIIAGFLCANGYLNLVIVFPLIVIGDIIGDSICYLLGRYGVPGFLKKIGIRFGVNTQKMNQVSAFFEANPIKTISLSKITLGIGVAGIYMAGNAKVPYHKFLKICLFTSAIQYVFYLAMGILFGGAYIQINHYLNYFASICIVGSLVLILFFLIKSRIKKL